MKCLLTILMLLTFYPYASCWAEINNELSRFIYEIPIMKKMEEYGTREGQRLYYGEDGDFEYAVSMLVLRNKEGVTLSASEIKDYYQNHFVSLGFRSWSKKEALTGRFQGPDLVTKGKAYIRSQGHISFWIPEQGNSITFWIYQRRDIDFRDSLPLLEKIEKTFSKVSVEHSFSFEMYRSTYVSGWSNYLLNECFVELFRAKVNYQKPEKGCLGDDGSYHFSFSIFPTNAHAEQWQKRIIEKVNKIHPYPNYFIDGLAFIPFVIDNVVIEYNGKHRDKENFKFRDHLLKELKGIK